MVLTILDLFCGLGGVAKGFQQWLLHNDVEYKYYACDNNNEILAQHELNNPRSIIILENAYDLVRHVKDVNFIWASPPCVSHSKMQLAWKNTKYFKKPDLRLYDIIEHLFLKVKLNALPGFVVENVVPHYRPPIKHGFKVGRHILFTNLQIDSSAIAIHKPPYKLGRIAKYNELEDWHELKTSLMKTARREQVLRSCMHYKTTYQLASQIFPQILDIMKKQRLKNEISKI